MITPKNEDILIIAAGLKNSIETLRTSLVGKDTSKLEEFISAVDNYSKYLEGMVQLTNDADMALQELISQKK